MSVPALPAALGPETHRSFVAPTPPAELTVQTTTLAALKRTSAPTLLFASVLSGYAAQMQLEQQRLGSVAGAALYVVAVALFVVALRLTHSLVEAPPASSGALTWRWVVAQRGAVLLALCGLAWMEALRVSFAAPVAPGAAWRGLGLWLASISLFVAAIVSREAPTFSVANVRRAIRADWPQVVLLAALTALAATLRLVGLDSLPYPFQGDEGSVGTAGLHLLAGQVGGFFQTSWSDQPTLSFAPTAVLVGLVGPDVVGARLWSALQGIAAVPLLYLLGRRLFGSRVGLLAAALLATWHLHIHFSRVAVNNGGDAFFAVLVFWLVYRASETKRTSDFLWAGLAAGFAWYSYVGTRLVFLLAAGFLAGAETQRAFVAARGKGLAHVTAHIPWRGLIVFAGVVVVVAGPQLLFFQKNPDIFMARMNQVGIVQSGWLAREAELRAVPQWHLVAEHVVRAFLVFVSLPAIGGFYNAPVPLLAPAASVLFVLGLGYCTVKLWDRRHLLLLAWFWSVVVLGGAMTVDVPNAGRLMLATPAVCLFVGLALEHLLCGLHRSGMLTGRQGLVAAAVVVSLIGFESAGFYFLRFVPGHHFVDANTETGHVAGMYLRELGDEYVAYFAGAPRVLVGFPSIPYLARGVRGQDLNETVTDESEIRLEWGKGAVFLAVPERQAELQIIRRRFPGGQWRELASRARPEPLLYAYELPRI